MSAQLIDLLESSTAKAGLSRRAFLVSAAAVGGGLMIGIGPVETADAAARINPGDQTKGSEFTGIVSIAPDNTVTIRTTKTEIGNGATTGMAMIVTEELGADWNKVRVEYMPPNRNSQRGKLLLEDRKPCLFRRALDRQGNDGPTAPGGRQRARTPAGGRGAEMERPGLRRWWPKRAS